ncbi:hypothetical protein KL934_002397, partial [Ogataea polymorpha]
KPALLFSPGGYKLLCSRNPRAVTSRSEQKLPKSAPTMSTKNSH